MSQPNGIPTKLEDILQSVENIVAWKLTSTS